ncbi:MAG: Hint domain-containing protein [Tabrizicola sp.]
MTQAAADDGRVQPVVAAGSPFGTPGARVAVECRIIARSNRVPQQDHVFHTVGIGDVKVGMIGEIPPDPDLHYTIIAAIDPRPGDALRLLGLNGPIAPDDAPVGPAGLASLFGLAHGTLIDTPDGPRKIEELRVGDLVTTLDNGSQPLRWTGSRAIPREVFLRRPELRPVLFEAAACGNTRPLLVLPGHRMLLHDWRAEVFFGEDQVLIAAKALVNGSTIRQVVPHAQATFCHLLFDRHEVILAEGALSESFHPDQAGLAALEAAQRQEIAALFPHMPLERRRAAFPVVGPAEARVLALPG